MANSIPLTVEALTADREKFFKGYNNAIVIGIVGSLVLLLAMRLFLV